MSGDAKACGGIEFFEPMRVPLTTHNALVAHLGHDGRPGIHKKAELYRAEGTWEAHLARHAPEEPMEGPLCLELRFRRPAAETGHAQNEPCTDVPDLDNWEKTVLDVMKRLRFFRDDAQVVDLRAQKAWADPQGVHVRLRRVEWKGGA